MSPLRWIALCGVIALATGAGCSSVSTVRVQPDNLYVGPGMRPIAVIHAQVTSGYLLFIPIPGHVDLDRVRADQAEPDREPQGRGSPPRRRAALQVPAPTREGGPEPAKLPEARALDE